MKVERLCCQIARPPIAAGRLSLTSRWREEVTPAGREEVQPDGRGGRDPTLADSAHGVFTMPIPHRSPPPSGTQG